MVHFRSLRQERWDHLKSCRILNCNTRRKWKKNQKLEDILVTSCFRSTMCISILLCSSSMDVESESYRAWTQDDTVNKPLTNTRYTSNLAVGSYLSFLRLFAADVSEALDLGLQLLRLSWDVVDFLGHLLTLVMDLVTLPGAKFNIFNTM